MKHSIICKEDNSYLSFPHISRLNSGRLVVVYRKAGVMSAKAALEGLTTHHDPDSSIFIIYSEDEGVSWSRPRKIYKSQYGVNDPALTVLQDGTCLLRFVLLEIQKVSAKINLHNRPIFSHRVEHGLVATVIGNMVLSSSNEGESWSELGISDPPGIVGGCSRDPILEMPDGSLLMSLYTGSPRRTEISWVIRSFDKGKTWHNPVMIMSDPNGDVSQQQGINYSETSLFHFGNGKLMALTRADETFFTKAGEFVQVGGIGELRASWSHDCGLSWTFPAKTGIFGTPGSLIKLNDGRMLATYGYRAPPYGVRCCFSIDQGNSWDVKNELIIRDDAPTWDCGYPFSIEISPAKILTVYYIADELGCRHIAATHWSLSQCA
jgi:sialidase-1